MGNSWEEAKKKLVNILGELKSSTAVRWIQLARDWDPAVADHVAGWKSISCFRSSRNTGGGGKVGWGGEPKMRKKV